jgi:phage shock protein A
MTSPPNPEAQKVSSDITFIEMDMRRLHSQVLLSSLRDRVEDLETKTKGFPQRVKNIRARQYAFESNLENRAEDLRKRWMTIRTNVHAEIKRQAPQLEKDIAPIEAQLRQVVARKNNPTLAQPMITRLKADIKNLQDKASAAERSIDGMFDQFQKEANELTKKLDRIEFALTELEQASFSLLPTEGGIRAIKATWIKSGKPSKDDPKGILFITDQRLIFEQKEEVATKKVLFVTTARQKVQNMLFEAPIGALETTSLSRQGAIRKQNHLELRFGSASPYPLVTFVISGQDPQEWLAMINRVNSGDFDKTRAIELDEEVVERVKSAPTVCPNCNAAITQQIMRGMDSINCEYCGSVIRL